MDSDDEEVEAIVQAPESAPEEHKDNMSVILTNLRNLIHTDYNHWKITDFEIGCSVESDHVYLVRRRTQFTAAVKVLYKSKLDDLSITNQVLQDIDGGTRIRHRNILKLISYFTDETRIFVVMEYAEQHDFLTALKNTPNHQYSDDMAASVILQVVHGLQHYHSNNVVYRDIKPEHLFIKAGGIKLADFGWCRYAPSRRNKTMCGTLNYLPPEAVDGDIYDEYVVLWSIGVLCYEILIGKPPLKSEDTNPTDAHVEAEDLEFPSHISEGAQDLIKKLLQRDPHERLPLSDILTHPWILQHSQKVLKI